MNKTLLMIAAAAAVALVIGYQRGVRAGAAQANAGPVIGTGTDWLNWQT